MTEANGKSARERIVSRLFWAGVTLSLLLTAVLNFMDHGGSDPAGDAMAKGYVFLFTIAVCLVLLVAAGLFGWIRRLWFRLVMVVAIYALATLLLAIVLASR